MTVHELLNGVLYAGGLAGALSGIGLFLHFCAVRPMRQFLRNEIVSSIQDVKHAVEINTTATDELKSKLEEHIANGGHVHS